MEVRGAGPTTVHHYEHHGSHHNVASYYSENYGYAFGPESYIAPAAWPYDSPAYSNLNGHIPPTYCPTIQSTYEDCKVGDVEMEAYCLASSSEANLQHFNLNLNQEPDGICFGESAIASADGSSSMANIGHHHGHHIGHHVGKPRKNTANKKERRRTLSINSAFSNLRECIPNVPQDTKLSKIKTLRLATTYIEYLMGLLSESESENEGQGQVGQARERKAVGNKSCEDFKVDLQRFKRGSRGEKAVSRPIGLLGRKG